MSTSDWIPAYAGMTEGVHIGLVIPAEAGIQTQLFITIKL